MCRQQDLEVVHLMLQSHELSSLVGTDTLQVLGKPHLALQAYCVVEQEGVIEHLQNVSAYQTAELMRVLQPTFAISIANGYSSDPAVKLLNSSCFVASCARFRRVC